MGQLIAIYKEIEASTQKVLDNIQSTLDTYPVLATDAQYKDIYDMIIGYQTTFTTKLANYKSTREGYQTEYSNNNCGSTTVTTIGGPATDMSAATPGAESTTTPYLLTTAQAGTVVTARIR